MEAMRSIELDFDNIRLAWEWAIQRRESAPVHAMLNSLYLFGFLGSRNMDVLVMFQESMEQLSFDPALYNRVLTRRWGFLHWWCQPNYEEALASVNRAMTTAVADNNRFEIAFCHLVGAYALMGLGRLDEAVSRLEMSKSLFEAIKESYYVCWVLHRLGAAHAFLDQPEKKIAYIEQSLALARQTQNRFALFICLFYLGSDHFLRRHYIKGKLFGTEALQSAMGTGQQCQIAHAEGLIALCAFYEGDYSACLEYAERSRAIVKDILSLIVQPYSLSLLVLLACVRENYDEGVRLVELENQHSPNLLGFQLSSWALAALSCGLGNPKEARSHIQKILQLSDSEEYSALVFATVPCAAYILADTDREKAVELVSWVRSYPDASLNWARQWPLFDRLQSRLHAEMNGAAYQMHWEKGQTISFEGMELYIQNEFRAPSASKEAQDQQVLTTRESEILRLMAAGMTNPQIATQLVIGAGTVKTHTLSIYRKLEVSNRTQAIVRGKELGVLDL